MCENCALCVYLRLKMCENLLSSSTQNASELCEKKWCRIDHDGWWSIIGCFSFVVAGESTRAQWPRYNGMSSLSWSFVVVFVFVVVMLLLSWPWWLLWALQCCWRCRVVVITATVLLLPLPLPVPPYWFVVIYLQFLLLLPFRILVFRISFMSLFFVAERWATTSFCTIVCPHCNRHSPNCQFVPFN